jgi:hypothetical protein
MLEIPDFDSLPEVPGQPQGNAWGLWGVEDQLGSELERPIHLYRTFEYLTLYLALNKITPVSKLAAAQEVTAGISVSLDLPLNAFDYVIANRIQFKQVLIDFKKLNGSIGHDDELHFNTQSSSQWDGLSHCAIQAEELYYNGLKHDDVSGKRDGRNGIHSRLTAPFT